MQLPCNGKEYLHGSIARDHENGNIYSISRDRK